MRVNETRFRLRTKMRWAKTSSAAPRCRVTGSQIPRAISSELPEATAMSMLLLLQLLLLKMITAMAAGRRHHHGAAPQLFVARTTALSRVSSRRLSVSSTGGIVARTPAGVCVPNRRSLHVPGQQSCAAAAAAAAAASSSSSSSATARGSLHLRLGSVSCCCNEAMWAMGVMGGE
jgi:hypothetical protein